MKKTLLSVLLTGFSLSIIAAQVGDMVSVNCQNPLIVLGKAQVTAVTSNTITVADKFDTFTFALTNVQIAPVTARVSAPPAQQTATVARSTSSGDPGMDILNKFQSDPNFSKAVNQYHGSMAKVMDGSIDVKQLRDMAAAALAQADQYGPERAKDPQYEEYIATLKDFVKRADAGEQFNFPTGNVQ
jgi:hypothetical protein